MTNAKLYVGNLPYSCTSEDLKAHFETFGPVQEVNIIEGKGFGFIQMGTQENADKAKAELNGTDFQGRGLRVDDAKPPRQKSNFSNNYDRY